MTDKIEVLRQVLGTMVQEPIYDNNVGGIIGEKQFSGRYVQKPIIEGAERDLVKNKLFELVKEL